MLEGTFCFGNQLSYFNEFAGGKGYLYLRDSNIDWGQGLKELGEFCKKKGYKEISLSYYCISDPSYYGINAKEITSEELKKPLHKVYALSTHHIDNALWYLKYKPVSIGGSIFVYDLRRIND